MDGMTLREQFEWDNNNSPQVAFKDGLFNPNYVEWFEKVKTPELIGLLNKSETQNKKLVELVDSIEEIRKSKWSESQKLGEICSRVHKYKKALKEVK